MLNLSGKSLGGYQIVEIIGAGGMGTVFKAHQPSLNRHVAIKVLPPHLSQDPSLVTRFKQEVRVIANLEHLNILPVYDHGEDNHYLYLVMRLIETGTVKDRLDKGPLSLPETHRVVTQIGSALAYAHQQGIIHRDLKPSNILVDAQGDCYLADFGIAKLVENTLGLTGAGIVGTPHYMAPEQSQALNVDHRADIYAIGVVIYQMVTGKVPFDASTPFAVAMMHLTEPLPPPRSIKPDLPKAIEQLILKALAKNPDRRYQHMADLVTDFDQAMQASSIAPSRASAPVTKPLSAQSPGGRITPPLTTPETTQPPPEELFSFIVGPPIIHPRNFFGRQRELKRIFNLWKSSVLQNAAIVGPPRCGKTSLLLYLKNITTTPPDRLRPAQRADWLPSPESFSWVFVNFQDSRLGSQEGLLRYLLRQLNLSIPEPCDLDRFMDVASNGIQNPTVIMLDEIGVALQRYEELDDSFWEGLRALATYEVGGNLAFVLAAHASPTELADHSNLSSPFFNIFGYTSTLGPLQEEEAHELINSSPIPFPAADVEWILAQSGGWPILLQALCRERLFALENDERDETWREEGLRQIAPFEHLLSQDS